MIYEWDEKKNMVNQKKHGISFSNAYDFHWDSAIETVDTRFDYGEERSIALGLIGITVHVLIFTNCTDTIRIIRLRKANKHERKYYDYKY